MSIGNRSDTFDVGGELRVHRLGLGAMRVAGDAFLGPPADEATARDLLRRAVELGVDLFDTADAYGPGVSERLVADATDTDEVVVATKAGYLRNTAGEWIPHGDPAYLHNQALVSRDRLGVDSIDLHQFHVPDPETPFADSVQAFAELKDEGVVDHVGLSSVNVDQLETARDHVEVATVQNSYSVAHRESEPVLEACEEYGIGFMPYFPLGDGDLGAAAGALDDVAAAHDASRYQVAIAWLLARSPVMLPIPGTSSVDHLEENVAAAAIDLADDEYARLAAVAPP